MGLAPHTPNNQIVKLSNKLIPQTTNRKTELLVTAAPAHGTATVTQAAVPRTACIGLRRTPPVTGETNGTVTTIDETVTARKT